MTDNTPLATHFPVLNNAELYLTYLATDVNYPALKVNIAQRAQGKNLSVEQKPDALTVRGFDDASELVIKRLNGLETIIRFNGKAAMQELAGMGFPMRGIDQLLNDIKPQVTRGKGDISRV